MIGYTASILKEAVELRAEADRRSAVAEERARLARAVHDGTLQVLALVQRRGHEAGGEFAELGRLAAEQEVALRSLMQGREVAPESHASGVVAALSRFESPTVTLSAPAAEIHLAAPALSELVAGVAEALGNVRHHVGVQARAWLLVEDLGDSVVVTVRDEGPGIAHGRLEEAAASGRLGVVESIRGRMAALGGTAELRTGPGQGTEWELRLPVRNR